MFDAIASLHDNYARSQITQHFGQFFWILHNTELGFETDRRMVSIGRLRQELSYSLELRIPIFTY
jgi:hypothetical protein